MNRSNLTAIAPGRQGANPRRRGYVAGDVIRNTFGFEPHELRAMAAGSHPLIRTRRIKDEVLFNWGDAFLPSLITTRPEPVEADPADDFEPVRRPGEADR